MQSTFVSDFKINKMTKSQYTGIVPNANEVYITTDEADAVLSVNGVLPNSSGNVSLSIPTKVSELTNDSGFITGITSGDVTTALGYTPVDKSGDTMTGDLTMSSSNIYINHSNTNPIIVGKRGDVRTGDTPDEAKRLIQVAGYDCDNTSLGLLQNYIGTSGNTIMELAVRNSGNAWASVLLSQTTDGTSYFSFPRCTTAATTTSTASGSKVAVVVQNYKNGNSWYRVWSDGWIEQGSLVQTTSSSYTVSFVKTFTTRNYTFQVTPCSASKTDTGGIGTVTVPVLPDTDTKTVSNIKLTSGNSRWIYWYACGY